MANPIDTLAAKVKAAQKGMEARREGLVGVFHTLAKQHGEASALIERLKNDASKRDALWPKIKLALLAHEKAELEVVYPVLADYPAMKAFVAQHAREASDLEAMILRLDDRSIVGDAWGARSSSSGTPCSPTRSRRRTRSSRPHSPRSVRTVPRSSTTPSGPRTRSSRRR